MCETCKSLFREKAKTALRQLGFSETSPMTGILASSLTEWARISGIWEADGSCLIAADDAQLQEDLYDSEG